jgi:hypothetical protein
MAVKRIFNKRYNALDRHLRRAAGRLSPAALLLLLESVRVFALLLLLFALTGRRAETLDTLGPRADAFTVVGAAALLTALRFSFNPRVTPALDRRFAARTYDERRILFYLGRAARGATNIDQLYEPIVKESAGALCTSHVAVFVRDVQTGDSICRVCR